MIEDGALVLFSGGQDSETDYSGYPDCRDDKIKALQVALNLGMARRFVLRAARDRYRTLDGRQALQPLAMRIARDTNILA